MTYYNRDNLFNYNLIQRGVQGNIGQQGVTGARGDEWELFSCKNYIPSYIGITTNFPNTRSPFTSAGGVLGTDNKIYCIPSGSTFILVINVEGNTLEYIDIKNGEAGSYIGGALAYNNKIYCAPFFDTKILVIDTIEKTASRNVLPEFTFSGNNGYYQRACLAPNGKIYFSPTGATSVLVVDPIGNTYYQLEITNPAIYSRSGQFKYSGIVCGNDGNLYMTPDRTQNFIAKIDVYNDIVIGSYGFIDYPVGSAGSVQNVAGSIGIDGNIYIPKNNTSELYKFDPIGITSSKIISPISFGSCIHTLSAPDGLIYFFRSSGNIFLTFNPITNIFNEYNLNFNYGSRCCVLHPNGKIYIVPDGSTFICELSTQLPKYPPWMWDAFFNKH